MPPASAPGQSSQKSCQGSGWPGHTGAEGEEIGTSQPIGVCWVPWAPRSALLDVNYLTESLKQSQVVRVIISLI